MTERRLSFDEVAEIYDAVRPVAPPDAVEALVACAALNAHSRVVEVGPGTGQLTTFLLDAGAQVTGLEPGDALRARCELKCRGRKLRLLGCTFEDWNPGEGAFDGVIACQSAHWIASDEFLDQCARALRAGGHVALLWHRDQSEGTPFWEATQDLYARYLPGAPNKPPLTIPRIQSTYERALDADARFGRSPTQCFPWSRHFDEDRYIQWISTHSGVRMLDPDDRRAFLADHREVIRKQGGTVERLHDTVLVHAIYQAAATGA